MFDNKDVAEYYNTTQIHYEKWWGLSKNKSLHYGIWEPGIKSFAESILNTNKTILSHSDIQSNHKVLDAGCGVGGAAFFINRMTKANVTGITLSEKQINTAKGFKQELNLGDEVSFQINDYTNTGFPDASFDRIWACESVCHANPKLDFTKEAYRLLKPGGKLVVCDFFKTQANQEDPNDWVHKWGLTWGVPHFSASEDFRNDLIEAGFSDIACNDYTENIQKSAKRLYLSALMGMVPSIVYNTLNPGVSRFARDHYKCGIYQYKALKADLWRYQLFVAQKAL